MYKHALAIVERRYSASFGAQEPELWRGPFPLHPDLVHYFQLLGPRDASLAGVGNPFFLSGLAGLWDYQEGYRFHGQQALRDWKDDWLVIADTGADPFIFSRATGRIFCDYHGRGRWQPRELFPNVQLMATSLLICGEQLESAWLEMNADGEFPSKYRDKALDGLRSLLASPTDAEAVLDSLGWAKA